MDKALRDKGLAMRKAVLGEDYVNKSMASADAFNGPFQEILNEYCWGMVWSDERLPKKTRSMLNLVMLACLGRMHEWELHLKGALTNGVTKDEIQAIMHQIAVYAGVPLGGGMLPRRAQGVRRDRQGQGRLISAAAAARCRASRRWSALAGVVRQAPGGDRQRDGDPDRGDDELRLGGREEARPARQAVGDVGIGLQGLDERPVLGIVGQAIEQRHAQERVAGRRRSAARPWAGPAG